MAFKPDLILLDVMLNGADGREICRNLHSGTETKNLPVILFSANPEMRKDANGSNAKAFIGKPFEIANFIETIKANVN
jgi:DNA-binding response OmpR family regulator